MLLLKFLVGAFLGFDEFALEVADGEAVFFHQNDEVLDDLLFVEKFRVEELEILKGLVEFLPLVGVRADFGSLVVELGNGVGLALELLAKAGKGLHVAVAALDFFVENYAVEAFALVEEFLAEIVMSAGHGAEAVKDFLNFQLGILNAFGNFHLLLAGEQGDLAHLLEIHADGVVEDVELGVGFLLFFFLLFLFLLLFGFGDFFDAVDIRGLDDLDLNSAELADDRVEMIGVADALGEVLVEIFVGQIALLFGESNEFPDFFLNQLRNIGRKGLNGSHRSA